MTVEIKKFQLYSSLTEKLKMLEMKKNLFLVPVWTLFYHPYYLLGPVITAFYQKVTPSVFRDYASKKREGAIRQQQKAYSVLTSRKMAEFHLWKHKSKNLLVIKFVLPPSYFKVQFLFKHTLSSQLVSVGYVVIPLTCFYFLIIMQKQKKKLWSCLV